MRRPRCGRCESRTGIAEALGSTAWRLDWLWLAGWLLAFSWLECSVVAAARAHAARAAAAAAAAAGSEPL